MLTFVFNLVEVSFVKAVNYSYFLSYGCGSDIPFGRYQTYLTYSCHIRLGNNQRVPFMNCESMSIYAYIGV